jgi:16S rRNA G966 N2-methylase RsmD
VQIRSLAALPKEMQQQIWLKAIDLSGRKQPTGKEIRYLVENLSDQSKKMFRLVSKEIQKGITEERKNQRFDALLKESENFRPLSKDLGKFSVILADPPWEYDYCASVNRAIVSAPKNNFLKTPKKDFP